jgi:hypothetical protein
MKSALSTLSDPTNQVVKPGSLKQRWGRFVWLGMDGLKGSNIMFVWAGILGERNRESIADS